MVRVLANGEVLADDDGPRPRGLGTASNSAASRPQAPSAGQSEGFDPANLWDSANARLTAYGLHPFTIGGMTFPPVALVLAVLALLFFGPAAALLVVGIVLVSQSSFSPFPSGSTQPSTSTGPARSSSDQPRRQAPPPRNAGTFGGSGQRLGGN